VRQVSGERLQRVAFADLDAVRELGSGQVLSRSFGLCRFELGADQPTAAVVLQRGREMDRGEPERGAGLDDVPSAAGARQQYSSLPVSRDSAVVSSANRRVGLTPGASSKKS
jgi:hypothetical protein